jgi:S-adenosylmethionine:diacylglycerol 3-amino-3-carboxypropyl transferase
MNAPDILEQKTERSMKSENQTTLGLIMKEDRLTSRVTMENQQSLMKKRKLTEKKQMMQSQSPANTRKKASTLQLSDSMLMEQLG